MSLFFHLSQCIIYRCSENERHGRFDKGAPRRRRLIGSPASRRLEATTIHGCGSKWFGSRPRNSVHRYIIFESCVSCLSLRTSVSAAPELRPQSSASVFTRARACTRREKKACNYNRAKLTVATSHTASSARCTNSVDNANAF